MAASGAVLDRFLRESLGGASWSYVRRLIREGKVWVAGSAIRHERHPLRPGDEVTIRMNVPKHHEHRLAKEAIVFVDSDLVVVNKPAGISTIPFDEGERGALSELVRDVLFKHHRGPRAPLGVVQRLDKETSGVMVFARTTRAKKHLQQQFRDHTIVRRYHALAHGRVPPTTLRSYLVADRGDGRRGSTNHTGYGRLSVTHVRPLAALDGATLVECRLETGRTHQIRIHLSEAGHPLLGERVYGRSDEEPVVPAPRVMLHARQLGFTHPSTGRSLEFVREAPEDFQKLLNELTLSPPREPG